MSLKKQCQYSSFTTGPTLMDLMNAIRNDPLMAEGERTVALARLSSETRGASPGVALKDVISTIFGGVAGSYATKYFGLGLAGRIAGALVGASMGANIGRRL